MVDPNNIVVTIPTKIDERQQMLGLLITTTQECRFYFVQTNIGNSITSSVNNASEHSRQYMLNFYENTFDLKEMLEKAGAKFVEDKEEADIDLSVEILEKDNIINLIQ